MTYPEILIDKQNLDVLIEIVQRAGQKILEIYNDETLFKVVYFKSDHSPLTIADKDSHKIIVQGLTDHFPHIPIISEEGRDTPYQLRKDWSQFWLIDPLDGTKEFVKRNGEFTINIALVRNNYPVFGLISAPFKMVNYWGGAHYGAFKSMLGNVTEIHVSGKKTDLTAVRSRSHASIEELEVYSNYSIREYISVGSALKFCMVAEGLAEIYYRHGPTMEWDIAAGQAIVEGAGGSVLNYENKKFNFNKISLVNNNFLVINNSDKDLSLKNQ